MLLKFRGWGEGGTDGMTTSVYFKFGQLLPSHHSMKLSLRTSGGQARGSSQSAQDQQPREPVQRDLLQVHGAGWQKKREYFSSGRKNEEFSMVRCLGMNYIWLWEKKVREMRIFWVNRIWRKEHTSCCLHIWLLLHRLLGSILLS